MRPSASVKLPPLLSRPIGDITCRRQQQLQQREYFEKCNAKHWSIQSWPSKRACQLSYTVTNVVISTDVLPRPYPPVSSSEQVVGNLAVLLHPFQCFPVPLTSLMCFHFAWHLPLLSCYQMYGPSPSRGMEAEGTARLRREGSHVCGLEM